MLLQVCDPPKSVMQDNFDPGRGNALQATISSIFGLTLNQVPNFIEMPEGYEAAIQDFCKVGGMIARKIILGGGNDNDNDVDATNLEMYEDNLCVLRGKSPRGDFGHVVVARRSRNGFEMIHDPHPDGTFLDTKETFGWCMIFVESGK